jgi:hypothetical protein
MRLIVLFASFVFLSHITLAGVIIQPVKTFAKSGSVGLKGDVTISEGSNILLTQIGQNITISATSGAATVTATTGYEPEQWILNGGISVITDFDGVRRAENNKTIQKLILCMYNSGSSGSTVVNLSYGPALASSTNIALAATGGTACTSTTPAISLNTNDLMNASVTQSASGLAEDLSLKALF